MSSAIVTAILFTVMLLIVGSFVFSAWRAHRQHLRNLKQETSKDLSTTTGRMMVVVQLLDGSVVGLDNQLPAEMTNALQVVVPSAHLSSGWYNRRRSVVSIGFLLMLGLGLLIETGAAGDALHTLTQGLTLATVQTSGASLQTAFQPAPATASSRIIRVNSASQNQYATAYEYQVWSFSSCSGISLEEVMNAYGSHYIASDILQVEQNMGIWNTYDGLTGGEAGMAKAAAHFGFQASPNPPRTLKDLIAVTNQGYPVIVGSVNHIMVIKGGDANYVYAVDSSLTNRQAMTYSQFMAFWTGFTVLIKPAA